MSSRKNINPVDLPSWKALEALHARQKGTFTMHHAFSEDPDRARRYSVNVALPQDSEIFIDYSKHLIDDQVLDTLQNLLQESGFEEHRAALFSGEHINGTEDRAVLHMALRGNQGSLKYAEDVLANVKSELDKVRHITSLVHDGLWLGYTGKPITHIVNIGIGGSDLGPRMVVTALKPFRHARIQPYFVSNVDGYDIENVLQDCPHDQTLFVIVSKTFTTQETMKNAETARQWFLKCSDFQGDIAKHFVAVSTNKEAIVRFGIPDDDEHVFCFWDFVGGRYSLWSTVGLSISLSIGFAHFESLLAGAAAMDAHFVNAPLKENAPVLLALLGVWYGNFYGAETHAVLPYEQSLEMLPRYLQQLDMESNGKNVTRNNEPINGRWSTGPIVWGEPGTNGQHAFYQLIHQGTKRVIPVVFLAGKQPLRPAKSILESECANEHHRLLLANMIAQAEALMKGTPPDEAAQLPPYRRFEGNHPSTTILYSPHLTPLILGALIAMYEHKVFVQGVIWNIYSFDQWGVELGKKLATSILSEDPAARDAAHDASTASLLKHAGF